MRLGKCKRILRTLTQPAIATVASLSVAAWGQTLNWAGNNVL
jgi:hypothetical protein